MLVRVVAVAVALLGQTVLVADPAASAVTDRIKAVFVIGQNLQGVDPRSASVRVSFTTDDCAVGCTLVRVGWLRSDYEEVALGTTTFPAQARPRTVSVLDRVEGNQSFMLDWHYELRKGEDFDITAVADADMDVLSDRDFTYDPAWRRELNVTTTETLVSRSATTGATAVLAPSGAFRSIGLLGVRGPGLGVMQVLVDGRAQRTVDLRANGWQPRQVVAVVDVPAGAELQVVNSNPAGRVGADVHLDGAVVMHLTDDDDDLQAVAAAVGSHLEDADAEGLTIGVALPQQVPISGATVEVEVRAQVFGCPEGCRVVRRIVNGSGYSEKTILSTTFPASSVLQPLTVRLRQDREASYRLQKNGVDVAWASSLLPRVHGELGFDYSYGWVQDRQAQSTGGTIMRSSTTGTGATKRLDGTFDGRAVGLVGARGPQSGVAAVYVDGILITTIDLYAPRWQPRQVLMSTDVPVTGRITIVNRTPADRTSKDVHVDALVELDHTDDWY